MANALYAKGAEKILSAAINFATDTIKAILVSSAYTANLSTDEFLANIATYQLGTAQTLTGKSVSGGKFNAASPITFPAVASGATAKAVVFYKDAGTAPAPVANTPSTSASGGTLPAGTYYYTVTALNAGGESIASNEVSITTTGSTSSNTVTWAASAGATGYRVYRGTASGGESVYYAPGNVTTFTDTGGSSTAGTTPAGVNALLIYDDTITGFPVATNGGDINIAIDSGTYKILSLV